MKNMTAPVPEFHDIDVEGQEDRIVCEDLDLAVLVAARALAGERPVVIRLTDGGATVATLRPALTTALVQAALLMIQAKCQLAALLGLPDVQ